MLHSSHYTVTFTLCFELGNGALVGLRITSPHYGYITRTSTPEEAIKINRKCFF